MESKRFQQQHKPPKEQNSADQFVGFAKRRLSELIYWYLQDEGILDKNGLPRSLRRNVDMPEVLQIR